MSETERLRLLQKLSEDNELLPEDIRELRATENKVERLFIFDNSGSMYEAESDLSETQGLFDQCTSKWEIGYTLVQKILPFVGTLDSTGAEFCFLNPIAGFDVDSVTGGTTISAVASNINVDYIADTDIDPYFNAEAPSGHTPSRDVLEGAVKRKMSQMDGSKKLYVTFITDGEPTLRDGSDRNTKGVKETDNFKRSLEKLSSEYKDKLFIQILSVTKEQHIIDYLKTLDRINGVDVTPDFVTLKSSVKKATGKNLSKREYLMKILLGAMVKKYDDLDKWKLHF